MTNLETMQDFLHKLETLTIDEMVTYMTENLNYMAGEGYQKPMCNFYEITDDYQIQVDFDSEDMYKAYYTVNKDELKDQHVPYINELVENIVENTDLEKRQAFYNYYFDEIDRQLLKDYLEENKEKLIEEIKEKIFYMHFFKN